MHFFKGSALNMRASVKPNQERPSGDLPLIAIKSLVTLGAALRGSYCRAITIINLPLARSPATWVYRPSTFLRLNASHLACRHRICAGGILHRYEQPDRRLGGALSSGEFPKALGSIRPSNH